MYVLGIDIGTQGVRGIVSDKNGEVAASFSTPFEYMNISNIEGHKEQDASVWWNAAVNTIKHIVAELKEKGIESDKIVAISLDGTSGTIVPIDNNFKPLCNGLLYNDARAGEEAAVVQEKGKALAEKLGYKFNSSYALPKMLWIKNHQRDIYENTHLIVHQTDYIVGCLTNCYNVSDYSDALKSGYDLIDKKWPEFIEKDLGIDINKLPKIVAPGTFIAKVSKECSVITGLSENTSVVAGATDGYASAIASGAIEPGDYNTSIGTTTIIKGVTEKLIKDEKGRIYCHLHPEGYWMPGGASNTGGKCLNNRFDKEKFDYYNTFVEGVTPTNLVIYPVVGQGERFPFVNKEAVEFIVGEPKDEKELYAALMEGVAYTERLAYDTLIELGSEMNDRVFITGGAVKSKEWSQIRANVLNKTLLKPCVVEPAMGSAIIAASKILFTNINEAARNMVRIEEEIKPEEDKVKIYEERYKVFKEECRKRNYI